MVALVVVKQRDISRHVCFWRSLPLQKLLGQNGISSYKKVHLDNVNDKNAELKTAMPKRGITPFGSTEPTISSTWLYICFIRAERATALTGGGT